jgi:hypothetical protein
VWELGGWGFLELFLMVLGVALRLFLVFFMGLFCFFCGFVGVLVWLWVCLFRL